jgi:hypothetical protein
VRGGGESGCDKCFGVDDDFSGRGGEAVRMVARDARGRFVGGPERTDETVRAWGAMLAGGLSIAQIAEVLALSRSAVYGRLKVAGLPTPARLHGTLAERLRTRMRPVGDCVWWTGGTTPQGYPSISVGGAKQSVSHLLLSRADRPIPHRAVVSTSCGHLRCVALPHLRVCAARDLPVLMAKAGRTRSGERHWNARLDWAAVDAIRASDSPAAEMARRYGVTVSTISAVRSRRRWNNDAGRPSGAPVAPAARGVS